MAKRQREADRPRLPISTPLATVQKGGRSISRSAKKIVDPAVNHV
jgi:hypothetical protein